VPHCRTTPEKPTINDKNEQSEIIDFFSTEHKAILTHHDTYLHMDLITKDRQKMGHLDEVLFKKGMIKLNLPTE
jgi:acetolactate decarboxylase